MTNNFKHVPNFRTGEFLVLSACTCLYIEKSGGDLQHTVVWPLQLHNYDCFNCT